MGLVIRRLDNGLVDRFVNRIRCLHGNRVIHKDDFARGLISSMRAGETVGILMDTNMTPPQGVFVPFFGMEACTGSGLARVALKTEAAVLPGFLLFDQNRNKYVLRFGESRWSCCGPTKRRGRYPVQHGAFHFGAGASDSARIRTSGFGCIGAGRPGRRASGECTGEFDWV